MPPALRRPASTLRLTGGAALLAVAVLASGRVTAQAPAALFASPAVVRLEAGTSIKMAFDPKAFVQLDVDGENVSVLPVLNESGWTQLNIYSFVVRESDGKYKLFYPVVSVLDAAGAIANTIKPRHEFKFAGAVLNNEFELPAGATRLVIHTRKEYVESGFESSFGPELQGMDQPVSATAPLAAAALGAVFPVAGLVAGIALLSTLSTPKGICTFGERGVIQLYAR